MVRTILYFNLFTTGKRKDVVQIQRLYTNNDTPKETLIDIFKTPRVNPYLLLRRRPPPPHHNTGYPSSAPGPSDPPVVGVVSIGICKFTVEVEI